MNFPAQRIALVTGASRGIGRAIARALGISGHHVIALARTVGGLEELDDEIRAGGGDPATLVPADLGDFNALDRLGAAIYDRWGKLDVFVGNAGVLGPVTPIAHITPRDWMEAVDINLTANYRLIRSLDPLLQSSAAGRTLFLSSGAAHNPRAYLGTYSVTKAALEMLALTYAAETAKTNVRVNVLNPGPMRTNMRAKFMPGEDPNTLPQPDDIAPLALKLTSTQTVLHGAVVGFREWKEGKYPRGL